MWSVGSRRWSTVTAVPPPVQLPLRVTITLGVGAVMAGVERGLRLRYHRPLPGIGAVLPDGLTVAPRARIAVPITAVALPPELLQVGVIGWLVVVVLADLLSASSSSPASARSGKASTSAS